MNDQPRRILVVDDERSMRELLGMLLSDEGYEVLEASQGREALDVLQARGGDVDLMIQDLRMPGMGGTTLLSHVKGRYPEIPVIIITAFSTWDNAVEAMRLGAYDYIKKPFDTETIRAVVARALEHRELRDRQIAAGQEEVLRKNEIIGNNPLMQEVFAMVKRIAPTDSTILIRGESGTGKELVARAIHYRSCRARESFVSVNCSAFTESLLESELFGHVRGSFTGAVRDKKGLFQVADKGTLFLDEIADMSLKTQVKILRVLEERKILQVGGTEEIPIDVRIIAATNKDIEGEVESGRFREDLYYRLNVIPLSLPPLRERKEDIPLLAGYFLAKYSRQMRKDVHAISLAARKALLEYDWPGNVRELENIIQRHVALCDGNEITSIRCLGDANGQARTVPSPVNKGELAKGINMEEMLEDMERRYLGEALRITEGNLTNAAKLLGLSYRSIRYKVKKLGLRCHR